LDEGQLTPAGSWHEDESALALAATPTQISLLTGTSASGCLSFELLGEVKEDAALTLTVDFNADGHIEHTASVPPTDWSRTAIAVRTPLEYRSARYTLRKEGPGRVVFSFVGVTYRHLYPCPGVPVTLQDGASCLQNETCTSGRCRNGKCQSCGLGGCLEGEACNGDHECMHGGCAAGAR
jgi:hypothetical protein